MIKRLPSLLLWSALALTAGCGGSGSSDSSSTTSTTSSGSVTAPSIATQPVSVSVSAGQAASFSVSASGGGTLAYQWRKGGTAISGATASTYTISSTASGDAGSYDVVVSNSAGSVTSSAATLTVASAASAPAIVTQPVSQLAAVGASVTLSVVASGSGTLSYQWRKGGTAIAGATSSSYTIASVASTDAGSYDVVVTNANGSTASSAVTLSVSTTTASSALSTDAYNAAMAFYTTLSSSQQSTVQVAWSLDAARKWSNLPASFVSRNGIKWGNLSTAQQSAASALIKTSLGDTGSSLQSGLQAADDYLNSIGGGSSYGAGNYYLAFLGTPTSTGFWILQITGHHLTWNIAFNGSYKSPTPLFLGIEPKASFTINGTSYDPMAAQRVAMANLGAALTSYSAAKLSGTYSDLLFGANGSGGIDGTCPRAYASVTTHGIAYSALSSSHQALVQAVIRAYVATQATEYANDLLGAYLGSDALAATYVAYAGSGTVTTNGDYFRIEGPRVWIEFSVQRGVIISSDIHYHTIWRDKVGDYGGKCVG
ncbi:DUF3500 domain-containing protein [Massilia forsythiae]|uniref:DUF3500 domain-containing protein n=1 Tax=Massilia forsythiae TaxID=2728020 RepID=A0A7Z2VXR4_9BURK|nr:DUF3500 domain-containing protein [Massilia forsythiae]QJE01064.1 DUF3500 domain-containing protein [Massilia forsythiae]